MKNIFNDISDYPKSIPVETVRALISSVCENPDVFSLQDRAAIVDRVNGKACSDDPEHGDKLVDDPELADTIDYHALSPRQSMVPTTISCIAQSHIWPICLPKW